MNRRKLVYGVLCFMMGIAAAAEGMKSISAITLISICMFFLLPREEAGKRHFLMVMFTMFLAGTCIFHWNNFLLESPGLDSHTGKAFTCTGIITDVQGKKGGMTDLLCKVEGHRVLCTYKGKISHPYSIIGRKIIFTLYLHKTGDNIYARSRKAGYSSFISGFLLDDFTESPVLSLKRQILIRKYNFTFPLVEKYGEEGKILPGILFGTTDELDEDLREMFSENGTAHLLAVSGLHIGILYSAFSLAAGKRKKTYSMAVFLFLLLIYATASSFSISVLRAVLMILISISGDITCRPYDMLTSAFFSSFVILAVNPYALFTVSFHLSFLAVIFIAFLGPLFREYIGNYASMTLSVQAGLGPYMLYVFRDYSLKGIVCNIPSVFLGTVIVPLGAACFFLYFFTGIRIEVAETVLAGLGHILININRFFSSSEILRPDLAFTSENLLILYYSLILYAASEFFTVRRIRREYFLLFFCGVVFFILMYILSAGALRYTG